MAELKTKKNDANVEKFIAGVKDEQKRLDTAQVSQWMAEITDEPAKMWGASIVGYGSYRYKYKTGREGDWFLTGFSPRKQSLTLYIMSGFKRYDELLNQLGKHKTGVSCLYIKRLSDVDADILKTLIKESVDYMRSIDQTKVTDE